MKIIFTIWIMNLFCIGVFCQSPYKNISSVSIDTNYNKIIFDNYWEFDTTVTKKLFGYSVEPKVRGVIYDFNINNTKMCYKLRDQEIPSNWLLEDNENLNLTFDVKTESTRWELIKVTEDRIVFRNWYPEDANNQAYPYTNYKKGKQHFIFKKVASFGC